MNALRANTMEIYKDFDSITLYDDFERDKIKIKTTPDAEDKDLGTEWIDVKYTENKKREVFTKIIEKARENKKYDFGIQPDQTTRITNFILLKQLEGEVFLVNHDQREVSIRFQEIGGNEDIVEEVVFDMEEISPADHDLLQEGSVVYWNIGYLDQASGRQRVSELRFRRLPIWTKRNIERLKEKAKSYKDFFSP